MQFSTVAGNAVAAEKLLGLLRGGSERESQEDGESTDSAGSFLTMLYETEEFGEQSGAFLSNQAVAQQPDSCMEIRVVIVNGFAWIYDCDGLIVENGPVFDLVAEPGTVSDSRVVRAGVD